METATAAAWVRSLLERIPSPDPSARTPVPCRMRVRPLPSPGWPGNLSCCHRMNQERPDTNSRRLHQYEALLETLEALTRQHDLTRLFHELAQRLRKLVDFDFISVLLHDSAADVMRLHILESEKPLSIDNG